MQSSRVRASSPRPLTRRSSKRDVPLKSTGSFHLLPNSPTTPSSNLSPFTNARSPVSPSITALATQPTTPPRSLTPPPTPAPSPTTSRSARHSSLRPRQFDLPRRASDLTRRQSDISWRQSDPTRKQSDARRQSDLTRRQSDLTRRQSDLTRRQSDLTRRQSDFTRKQSDLTRRKLSVARQSRRQILSCMPERTSISPPPASPRKVRFGVESVGHIAGDSSDEEDDFDPDSMVESYATATSPSAKDQEDSQMRYGENFGHESPRGRIAESDNDVSNRGRRSNRGALGKKVSTSFVRRGNNSEDDGGEVEAKDSRVTHGSSAGPDESTLKKRTSTIEKGEKSTSRGGRSPCRAASSKRSSTPFAKKRVSWKHENDDENENDREVSEKNGSVVVHASSQDRNMDDGAMRTGRSADQNDGEPVSVRQGRSSGRGSTAKRSTTPFARRSVDWEDEDDGEGAEPASGNKSDSNAQFDPRERKSESDDDSHVMRGRSSSENDDGPTLSSRGRSSSRGTRAKRSSTPFFRRDVHWTEEDESSDDGADAQSASAKGKDYNVAETSSDMGLLHGPVNEKDEGAEKVGRIGLVVHQEKEECLATAKEDDEQRDGQLGTDAVRKNGAGTNERGKDKHHQATVLDNGDLQVIVPCSCGKVQILTYNSRTGVNIEPC